MDKNAWLICLCFRTKTSAKSVGSKIVVRILNPYEARTVDTLIGNTETATRSGVVLEFLFGKEYHEIKRIDWFGERRSAEDEDSAIYLARTWLRNLERERRPGLIEYPRHENFPLPVHKQGDQKPSNSAKDEEALTSKTASENIKFDLESKPISVPEEDEIHQPNPQQAIPNNGVNFVPFNDNVKRAVLREWVSIIRKGLLKG